MRLADPRDGLRVRRQATSARFGSYSFFHILLLKSCSGSKAIKPEDVSSWLVVLGWLVGNEGGGRRRARDSSHAISIFVHQPNFTHRRELMEKVSMFQFCLLKPLEEPSDQRFPPLPLEFEIFTPSCQEGEAVSSHKIS